MNGGLSGLVTMNKFFDSQQHCLYFEQILLPLMQRSAQNMQTDSFSVLYTIYCKTFPVKHSDNVPVQYGLTTQYYHANINVFHRLTVHFCNRETFPRQTICGKL